MTLKKPYVRSVLALAVCQMLMACTPVLKNNFVSHFANDQTLPSSGTESNQPLFDRGAIDGKGAVKSSDNNDLANENTPSIMLGTGKVLGDIGGGDLVKGPSVKLSFEEAPISQVVRAVLGDILKVDYVLQSPLNGVVTLNTQRNIPADQVLGLLETALQANNLALARDTRGVFHVGTVEALRTIGAAVRVATPTGKLAPGYGVIILPLQYIGAAEMASILRPMGSESSILRVDSVRNILVMAGTATQAQGWMEMVRTFDIDLLQGMSVGIFPLKYVSIEEAAAALQLIGSSSGVPAGASASAVNPGRSAPGGNGAAGASTNAAATGSGAGGSMLGPLHVMPIARLNSLLVITPRPAYLEQVRRWISKFDQSNAMGAQAQLHIYEVQNGNAKHLSSVLGGIFGGEASSSGSHANSGVAPGLNSMQSRTNDSNSGFARNGSGLGTGSQGLNSGMRSGAGWGSNQQGSGAQNTQNAVQGVSNVSTLGNVRIMADELNNSVLIWGTPAEYEPIEAALKRLDVPPTQILIEASIIEVTLTDELRYGLEWAFSNSGGGYTGSGSVSGNRSGLNIADPVSAGFTYTLRNSFGDIRAALQALSSKTNLKVVASPTLMVLDNHSASIMVGQQQPYQSGQALNTDGNVLTTNVQYKDTGVSLNVTPSVNAGNMVTMAVEQTVTDVGAEDTVTKQRTFLQRQVSSRVAVRSGESIVMGGLIQESNSQGRNGVPLLHELPIVGNLFGATTNTGSRTELIVVITPRVVRTDIDIRDVTNSLREQMSGLRSELQPVPPVVSPSFESLPAPSRGADVGLGAQ